MTMRDVLAEIDDWPVDTVAAAVISGDEVTTHGEVDNIFDLMSVTKPLSAWAFLVAVEEGIFELDEPLGPEGSTVRHLLAHASGVGFDSREPERDVEERRIYSSAGFEILAEKIEEVAGMTFRQYLRLAVLDPLEMHETALYGSAGHEAYSTLNDMIAFTRELIHPQLLHEKTVRDALSVQYPDLRGIVPGYGMQKPSPWGLGLEMHGTKDPHWMGTEMPEETFGHFGMSGTYLWMVPEWVDSPGAGTGAVVLTDRQFGDWAKPLWQEFNDEIWAEITR
ncbi:serine hydrolase [Corynebacterium yudongzhengii]|uniref:Serine hydrolase n=1 Tax=Corynebacterium yudongzhengii TaxID=2080740 RepID=A0A2U1T7K9_9CORY|nr:serine hydrolase domain-containing protein [Corynebacterium yudongzhengii]AWB82927.1 serine hydrolase [Corynebacterium yudongzhengii]PWC01979.1 serine hydrolase [Corynebacterium yudongzhengii]